MKYLWEGLAIRTCDTHADLLSAEAYRRTVLALLLYTVMAVTCRVVH